MVRMGVAAALSGPLMACRERSAVNRFAYDSEPRAATDAKWLHYEQVGQFRSLREEPRRIAVGPQNQLYLAAGRYVSVLDSDGALISEIALSAPVRCLAVAPDGFLYAGTRNEIECFDPGGVRTSGWKITEERAWLTGLTVGPSDVYAADAGRRVVLRYDRSGKIRQTLTGKGEGRARGFIVPSPFFDIEFGDDGLLRVANPGRHQVELYTPEGDFHSAWGEASAALEGFCGCCNPTGLALLRGGRAVTCEKGMPRVKVYDGRGKLESVVLGPESFAGAGGNGLADDDSTNGLDVAVDTEGRIYVLDAGQREIRVMARKNRAALA